MNVHSVAGLQLKTPKQQPSSLQTQLQRSMLQSQPKPAPTPAAITNAAMGPRQLQVEDALQYLDKV